MSTARRQPDIENLYAVLQREKPARPTLFELFMNDGLYTELAGYPPDAGDAFLALQNRVDAFAAAGYDYATTYASDMAFPRGERRHGGSTVSMNEGFVITDEASFEAYRWPDPEAFDCSKLERIGTRLPGGMKLMVMGPGGVLENATELLGYENMCFMLYENPALFKAVCDKIGAALLRYYEIAAQHASVGLVCANDDWGFNTQTLLSPDDLRRYIFPWHRKIVQAANRQGKPAVLHSCGNLAEVMDDIVEMGFAGKHSYEDAIMPVEQAYEHWHGKIAILGGMDVDFMVRSSEADIARRCAAMLECTAQRGGYALGTGNSVPAYLPQSKYFAMTAVALNG